MAHERFRKFNTKDTYPDQELGNDFCQVVKAGNLIFVRGQIGTDFEGRSMGIGDPGAQAEQALKNVKILLEEVGSCLDHICKITVYITDRAYRDSTYQAIGKALKGVFPVSTGLIVQGLGRPEWLIEIDVIAAIPDARAAT